MELVLNPNMNSTAAATRRHYTQTGWELCIHTCQPGSCTDRSETTFWKREGHAVRRHAVNSQRHPKCSESCPGFVLFQGTSSTYPTSRPPNDAEMLEYNAGNKRACVPEAMAVDSDGEMDLTPDDNSHNTLPASPGFAQLPFPSPSPSVMHLDGSLHTDVVPFYNGVATSRTFRIMFVPDPTRALHDRSPANDLSWIKTTITTVEYNVVRHLSHCLRVVTKKTRDDTVILFMHEWVS
jgi:hypothetical protein